MQKMYAIYRVVHGHLMYPQLWNYQTGIPLCIGNGHAAAIVTCKYSPCGKFIVSGSADGAVFMWKVPEVITCYLENT